MSAGDVRPGFLLPHRATLLACSGLMLGLLVAVVNSTIVATALPEIVADLGGLDAYSWVFTSYILASTVTVPIWGRLSDVHGRRPFFAAGLLIFMLGSVVGALAQSMTVVIVARTIQGVGSGALVPLAAAGIADLVPSSERGRWQGMIGVVIGGGSVLGPLMGGWIADNADWRWVFIVSLPFGLLALVTVTATLHIPPHPERAKSLDVAGAALLGAGLCGLLVAIVEAGNPEGISAGAVLVPFVAGVVLLLALVRHERRVADPIIPLELTRDPLFRRIGVAGFCTGVALFGSIMFLPLFAQGVLGATASRSGLMLMPLMLAMMVTSVGSGQMIARTGRYRWALLSGPPVVAFGYLLFLGLGTASSDTSATLAAVALGAGVGFLHQNLLLVLQNGVHSRHLGVATSAVQMTRNLGSTAGVSVFGAILVAGLPAGATSAAPAALAHAMRPIFVCGLVAMAVAFATVLRIPEVPLRVAVRDEVPVQP